MMLNILLLLSLNFLTAQTPVQMQVDGMSCSFCVNSVYKTLSTDKNLSNIKISLEDGMVFFDVKEGVAVDADKLMADIERAGYQPRSLELQKSGSVNNQAAIAPQQSNETIEFNVNGNCAMCKRKIETAAKSVKGVKTATWDMDTHKMKVVYDGRKTKSDDIHKKIADSGYDTDKVRAKDEIYNALHSCCKYDRAQP